MSGGPLDVALRVRWLYEAGGAKQATGDLDQVAMKAQKLGGLTADKLGRDLREVGGAAQGANRALADTATQAAKLGGAGADRLGRDLRDAGTAAQGANRALADTATQAAKLGGAGAERLEAGLKRVEAPAREVTRRLEDVGRAAARFGSVSTVSYLSRDLQAATVPADRARRELAAIGDAAGRLGQQRGITELDRGLVQVARHAEEAARKLGPLRDAQGRFIPGGGVGSGGVPYPHGPSGMPYQYGPAGTGGGIRARRHDFGNEALMASGLGTGLRFGMSGAAVGGLAAGGGIAATAAVAAKATREAISFETAMAEVQKAVNDLSPEKLAALERKILQVSAATGIAKEQMALLTAQAGFAGRPTEDLSRFAEFGSKAAVAFGMTAEAAGDALAKLGNVFKLRQADIEDLANGINVLGDNTAAKERQLVGFLYRAGEKGDKLGLNPFQTAAIGAGAIAAGREEEVAATAFNAIASKLGDAKNQSKDFQKGLRDIGLNARQLKAEFAKNPFEAYMKFLEKIDALPKDRQIEVANKIGGLEHGPELLTLAGQREEIRKAYEKVRDQAARSGSVEKAFKIFDATTERNIARTTAAVEGFAARIGKSFTPAVSAAAGAVERWFNGMNKAMDRRAEAEALAGRMAKGEKLSPQDQARIDADPRLKDETDKALFYDRRRLELEANRRKAQTAPGELPSMDAFRQEREEKFRQWEERRQRALNPPAAPATPAPAAPASAAQAAPVATAPVAPMPSAPPPASVPPSMDEFRHMREEQFRQMEERRRQAADPSRAVPGAPASPAVQAEPALPGTGKRSELSDEARVSLAAYENTVERSLDRTERIVREASRRMRDELALGAKVELASLTRPDQNQAVRIERASLGGGSLGGGGSAGRGYGGGSGGFGSAPGREGGGSAGGGAGGPRVAPGRFGGLIPPRAGERHQGGQAGGEGAHEKFGGGGGTRGAARTGEMMSYAMDQLRREGVPEAKLREAAAHLVGQAQMESGLDPNKSHDGGTGFGIYGARDPSPGRGRRTEMFKWLEKNGYARNSAEGQMRYMAHEAMSGRFKQTRRILMGEGSGDIEHDTNTITREFESPKFVNKRSGAVRNALRTGPEEGRPGRGEAGAAQAGENGKFDPLGGAARRYSSGYGMREHPVHGGRRMHHGQDLAAPGGTSVHSMEAGEVTQINRHGDVTVKHPDGSTKTYRHITPGGIKQGQRVEASAPIGRLRHRDPRSTGPHLHMEATDPQGRRYDPRAEIEAAGRQQSERQIAERKASPRSELPYEPIATRRPAGEPIATPRPGLQNRPAPQAEETARPRRELPTEGAPGTRSPRFAEPRRMEPRARPAAEPQGGGQAGRGGGSGGGPAIQNFYGGFDAGEVARRATLERNREVRRSLARGLSDGGMPA